MKRQLLALAILAAISGCRTNPAGTVTDLKALKGVVIEKRANVKSYEAWNAPSDPYYVLDMGTVDEQFMKHMQKAWRVDKHHVTLRPSENVTTDEIGRFKNKKVTITAEYTDGQRYTPMQPTEANPRPRESYPIEPEIRVAPDGSIQEGPMQPAKRGRGYIVHSIREQDE